MAKNIIVLNRGDTYSSDLTIVDDSSYDGRYHLQGNDTIYFGLMDPNQKFEDALVKKKFTKDDADENSNLIITLEPEDTLDLIPGVYYYAVKIHLDHEEINPETNEPTGEYIDEVFTVIPKTKCIIND